MQLPQICIIFRSTPSNAFYKLKKKVSCCTSKILFIPLSLFNSEKFRGYSESNPSSFSHASTGLFPKSFIDLYFLFLLHAKGMHISCRNFASTTSAVSLPGRKQSNSSLLDRLGCSDVSPQKDVLQDRNILVPGEEIESLRALFFF